MQNEGNINIMQNEIIECCESAKIQKENVQRLPDRPVSRQCGWCAGRQEELPCRERPRTPTGLGFPPPRRKRALRGG